MHLRTIPRFARFSALGPVAIAATALAAALTGCGESPPPVETDAGPVDGGPPAPPPSTDHCTYVALPPNAHAGGTVSAGVLSAGAAERRITIPLGATLGAYTGRSSRFGNEGFIDDRHTELAGTFAPSVGIETWPMVRAIAITTGPYDDTRIAGDETILIVKAEIGAAYQGLTHELEARLGPELAGKVLFTTSHSHSSFANFTGHSALQLGFGEFHRTAFEALLDDMEAAARAALAARRPARIGFAHDGGFDPTDRVNRDRRGEDDDLQGGRRDDHDLYVIRIDGTDGVPIAVMPVFGIHGTIYGGDNVLVAGDAPGGVERALEDEWDAHVVIAHLQGAAGDVSPAGLDATQCPAGAEYCHDFARAESVGWNARAEILAAWEAAGESMVDSIELEMVTRSVNRGPDPAAFTVRGGALEYAPFDLRRRCDAEVWEDPAARTRLISPIDEFNAPYGAALCGDSPLVLGRAQMPGTDVDSLRDTPYRTCLMIQGIDTIIEAAFEIPLEEPPICDTTRTTVSAVRLGDHVLITLPGEPATLLVDRLHELVEAETGIPLERAIAIGYAQDHGGYMLTAEDWMRGGYEPTITFWGPLEGEAIMEQAVALVPLVLSPERDDGVAGGTTRVVVPMMDDSMAPDPAPMMGTVPAGAPAHLATRLSVIPEPQPADVARLESAYFTWIGADPLAGTPVVVLERESETAPGTFEPVTRRSGRAVADGSILLTWTPDPLDPGGARTHYYTAEWQAVGWTDDRESAHPLIPRLGAPAGEYRFHVYGPETGSGPLYELTSDPFTVSPAALQATLSGSTLEVTAHAPTGFRLLDLVAGATRPIPLRGVDVEVAFDGGAPTTVTLDGEGRGSVAAPGSWTRATITDPYGNAATITP